MSELDEKLKNILRPYFNAGGIANSSALPKCVDEIKQAFVEAGWITPDERRRFEYEAYEAERKKMVDYIDKVSHPAIRVLTKHKDYASVEMIDDIQYGGDAIQIVLAAKKASGLE